MTDIKDRGTPIWRIDPFSSGSGARDGAKKADDFGDKNRRVTTQELDNWIAHNEAIIAQGNANNVHDYKTPEGQASYNISEANHVKSVIANGPASVAAALIGVTIRGPMSAIDAAFSRIFKNVI